MVLSTASKERVTIFDLLLAHDGISYYYRHFQVAEYIISNCTQDDAELSVLRLVDKDNVGDVDSVQQISLKSEFAWVMSEDFRRLRESGIKEGCLSTPRLEDDGVKEKLPLSSQEFVIPDDPAVLDKEAAFWNIYDKLEQEQKNDSNHMQVDKNTVSRPGTRTATCFKWTILRF